MAQVKLIVSRRMLNAIRRQIENRIENIHGFGAEATKDRSYRNEIARLSHMLKAIDGAQPVKRRRKS